MPELPEVETIRRGLEQSILGKQIMAVEVRLPKMVRSDQQYLVSTLTSNAFTKIRRRGKLLLFALRNTEHTLLLHLKMTGQLVYQSANARIAGGHSFHWDTDPLPNKYSHVIFTFADESRLFFNDQRQFGYLELSSPEKVERILHRYGIEPGLKNFTFENFQRVLQNRKAPLKQVLLDQTKIAGLGNIYVDEACFAAGVHPERVAGNITLAEQKRLFTAIQEIIAEAITHRGTTFRDYADTEGREGNYSQKLQVYGRAGEPCINCGSPIQKVKLSGRGTHFCEYCQR